MNSNQPDKRNGLATEKDIDPRHGLFEDQPQGSKVPSAEDELLRTYPSGEGTYGGVKVDSYTVASSAANEQLADDVAYAEAPTPGEYARQREGGDYAVETPRGEEPLPGSLNADAELELTEGTPVDPVSPPDEFHGTDLLNGVGSAPEEEDR
ncbi:hypothetical protein [Paenibacillus herberti]|uniref:DUF5709 domain-containing protein n=1 Tax=Paenibacillus herberti TaxID=1619309 RepID=A0A229P0P5_9BACL|nr:hypothetical protein [Paenibacillus herberti]OXM15459.1 hypothetical protein CGZ75_01590 [Paenibacillus herberti]